MADELFDIGLKIYKDLKRAREKLESFRDLDIQGSDVYVIVKKIREENRKIYEILQEVLGNGRRPKKEYQGAKESQQD